MKNFIFFIAVYAAMMSTMSWGYYVMSPEGFFKTTAIVAAGISISAIIVALML